MPPYGSGRGHLEQDMLPLLRSLQLNEGVTTTEKLLYFKKRFIVQNVEAAEKFQEKNLN